MRYWLTRAIENFLAFLRRGKTPNCLSHRRFLCILSNGLQKSQNHTKSFKQIFTTNFNPKSFVDQPTSNYLKQKQIQLKTHSKRHIQASRLTIICVSPKSHVVANYYECVTEKRCVKCRQLTPTLGRSGGVSLFTEPEIVRAGCSTSANFVAHRTTWRVSGDLELTRIKLLLDLLYIVDN